MDRQDVAALVTGDAKRGLGQEGVAAGGLEAADRAVAGGTDDGGVVGLAGVRVGVLAVLTPIPGDRVADLTDPLRRGLGVGKAAQGEGLFGIEEAGRSWVVVRPPWPAGNAKRRLKR